MLDAEFIAWILFHFFQVRLRHHHHWVRQPLPLRPRGRVRLPRPRQAVKEDEELKTNDNDIPIIIVIFEKLLDVGWNKPRFLLPVGVLYLPRETPSTDRGWQRQEGGFGNSTYRDLLYYALQVW